MAKVSPWYSRLPSGYAVYHDETECFGATGSRRRTVPMAWVTGRSANAAHRSPLVAKATNGLNASRRQRLDLEHAVTAAYSGGTGRQRIRSGSFVFFFPANPIALHRRPCRSNS